MTLRLLACSYTRVLYPHRSTWLAGQGDARLLSLEARLEPGAGRAEYQALCLLTAWCLSETTTGHSAAATAAAP